MNSTEPSSPQNNGAASSQVARPMRLNMLLVGGALLAIVLTVASIGWWSGQFGKSNPYTTIGQQQTHNRITVRITKVYADEGRAIIAYEIFYDNPTESHDNPIKGSMVNKVTLTADAPQKKGEGLGSYFCSSSDDLARCYSRQHPFLVEKGKDTLTMTFDVGEVLLINSNTLGKEGRVGKDGTVAGPWRFVFTVPFHHTINTELPDPINGLSTI